jgi:pimeloyl-ACP methyl ester carboxylesterase
MKDFSSTHRVIALDIPGLSSVAKNSQSNYDFNSLSLYLIKILTCLGINKATFVGHCVAGNLAQLFKNQFPSYVDKLVLVSP